MRRSIIQDRVLLKQKCEFVTVEELPNIVKDLRDSIEGLKAYGLAAPQIGINKQVAIINIKEGKMNLDLVLVNPVILEKWDRNLFHGEACLSFPGLLIDTDRYMQITVQNGFGGKQLVFLGLESVVVSHEIDHLNGITILDRKHRSR